MANEDFNITHPLFDRAQPIRQRARDLFAGSHTVKENSKEYLFETENETTTQYDIRLKRAVYENWPKVVIDNRQALTWKNSVKRNEFRQLEKFIDDVDGFGTSADSFFRMVTESSSVGGMDWVLVDKTRLESDRELSKQEEQELGLRPKFIHIKGENVLDWQLDSAQKLDWVVIRSMKSEPKLPGSELLVKDQRVVWFKEFIQVWEQITPEKVNQENVKPRWELVGQQLNPLGEIPLIPFYGIRMGPLLGLSVIKDILDHTVSIYNKFSDRDWFEYLSNSPVMTIIGGDKPEKVNTGSNVGIYIPSTNGKKWEVKYLEPTGAGAQSSRDSERDLIRRIFEIALRQTKRDSAQVQSFQAQREEVKIFRSSLAAVTEEFEISEQRCWDLAAKWEGLEDWEGEVKYNRDFDDKMIEASMITAFSNAVERNQLSRSTFLEQLIAGEVLSSETDIVEEINRIRQDQDDLAMPSQTEENA